MPFKRILISGKTIIKLASTELGTGGDVIQLSTANDGAAVTYSIDSASLCSTHSA